MGDALFVFQNTLSFGHSFWDTLILGQVVSFLSGEDEIEFHTEAEGPG